MRHPRVKKGPVMHSDPDANPVNPIPAVVVLLFLGIAAAELVLSAAGAGFVGGAQGVGWRTGALTDYSFFGQVWDQMLAQNLWPFEHLRRFVTYPFVHFSFTHALFAGVFLLALGKFVGEVMGPVAVLVVFFTSAITGALAYAIILNDPVPLVGAFPAVYGLIGAFTFILWVNLGRSGDNQWRAFSLIGMLVLFQLVFSILFGTSNDWVAEIAGFMTGFVISPLVVPGGARHLLGKLRRR
jgi:membrane associated rhomboid family serine protease